LQGADAEESPAHLLQQNSVTQDERGDQEVSSAGGARALALPLGLHRHLPRRRRRGVPAPDAPPAEPRPLLLLEAGRHGRLRGRGDRGDARAALPAALRQQPQQRRPGGHPRRLPAARVPRHPALFQRRDEQRDAGQVCRVEGAADAGGLHGGLRPPVRQPCQGLRLLQRRDVSRFLERIELIPEK
jgi:hypothetical protein